MLRFFHPRLSLSRHLPGGVDAHCHLLPGVDDGAASAEEALSIIRGQQALGLRGAICTPHIMARYPQNTPDHLRLVFNCFVADLEDKGIATGSSRCSSPSESGNTPDHLRQVFADFQSIVNRQSAIVNFRLHLAAEYMLDEAFPRHLASGDLLTIDPVWLTQPQPPNLNIPEGLGVALAETGKSKIQNQDTAVNSVPTCLTTSGKNVHSTSKIQNPKSSIAQSTRNYVLVELPQYLLPPGWQDMLDSILAAGHTPLLAHPERYLRILDEADLRAMAERGIALQGNLGSLTGYYGSRVKSLAQSLHADGLYTTWGTDSHSYGMLRQLKLTA